MLPVEILRLIAAVSPESYRAMLAIPEFACSLDPGTIADYMIAFGYSVQISCHSTRWCRNGRIHRIGGPAVEYANGDREWWRNGLLHNDGAPAVVFHGGRDWFTDGEFYRRDYTRGIHVRQRRVSDGMV